MKRILKYSVFSLFLAPVLLLGAKPEHAVIFIIDGLSYKALDRLPLKNLKSLVAAGTYYEKSYNILPAHPHTGEWARYQRASIPNPVILAGTVLLLPGQQYVQQSFYPDRITAHAAGQIAYTTLNADYNMSFLAASIEGREVKDADTIGFAIDFLRKGRPAFMRIHLQDTGKGGSACRGATDRSVAWRHNIWGEGSPYTKAAVQADQYLGMFVDQLKALGLLEKTVLFVTADHGQADTGWHPFEDEDGWAMPLVVAGPGVRSGQRFPYAEQIDIVPTLCHLMGVKPPSNADGRVLAEALETPPAGVPQRGYRIRELNRLLMEGDARISKLRQEAEKSPSLKNKLKQAERDFYGIDRILEWHRFGSVEKLLAHNRAVLEKLSASERGTP